MSVVAEGDDTNNGTAVISSGFGTVAESYFLGLLYSRRSNIKDRARVRRPPPRNGRFSFLTRWEGQYPDIFGWERPRFPTAATGSRPRPWTTGAYERRDPRQRWYWFSAVKAAAEELAERTKEECDFVIDNHGRVITVAESYHRWVTYGSRDGSKRCRADIGTYHSMHATGSGLTIPSAYPGERVDVPSSGIRTRGFM